MKAVVFTVSSIFRLSNFSVTEEWFGLFGLPEESEGLKRVIVGDVVYIIENGLEDDVVPIVVLNVSNDDPVFVEGRSNANVLDRIIVVARSVYTNSVVIPTGWRQHHEGSLLSIQAQAKGNWRSRLHFNTHPNGGRDLFAFCRTDEVVAFDKLSKHDEIYNAARDGFAEAILTEAPSHASVSRAGITLSQRLPQGFVQGASLEQWYESKLTAEQRNFVDKPHDGPVRLRGAAGTGKTLSLVIKFLRDALTAKGNSQAIKLGFLAHSFASVDLVSAIGESLDKEGLLHTSSDACKLEIRTLYDLAYEHLRFNLDDLQPLSLDGREGRRLQFELIESVLRDMAASPFLPIQYSDLSPIVMKRWKSSAEGQDRRFVAEVMNEFASVLDAEGIRAGEEKGERYVRGGAVARPSWLMVLASEIDRRFVLEAHRRYRKLLGEMNTLSVDQMIGDFNSFLDSNRWDRVRGRLGYDAIFVDELHLFTSIERQTLHKLVRKNVEDDGRPRRPPIFMAYDLKQSPQDTFIQYGEADHNLFSSSTKLQNSELVKLDKVFRYTPQIAEFLSDLDAAFPAIDIPGEWNAYAGKAELADGSVPELIVFKDERTLFESVFAAAERSARVANGGGRRVAVLCVSEERFDEYLRVAEGRYSGRHLPITSRDASAELRHTGKRFIFSMPEYVAGLQFETVFLIHVDAQEATIDAGDGVRRRFISSIYLGSSRAEKTLKICSCINRGGQSDTLQMSLDRRSLIAVERL